jgi:hypothetical protein
MSDEIERYDREILGLNIGFKLTKIPTDWQLDLLYEEVSKEKERRERLKEKWGKY